MEALKTIANISGYPGLYRILKPGRSGVIVEALDAKKAKTMMGPQARVSVLNDISMYVDRPDSAQNEQSVPLGDILMMVADTFGDELPVTAKADGSELADFMAQVLPDYDRERVRDTDIRKLISWYTILRQFAPEAFEKPEEAPVAEEATSEQPATDEKAAE
ncbi:DUF5606 family protein [Fibrivirga algicola]|uniref:DUF5606 domain-containing protein n=1 Tax=Fibrivirga algicola TaxID=2950420 RepID=A0ABX0Q9N8_9BACT|nr:DUF5606 domain-containing protein [Fibrivirga algicola]ARK08944.1 hypothetical protein A6C57_00695 [Fibrella sp. ES10-3-2-2]NID08876.1 hypothetical protein [Fibrivirga algicola]